MKTYTTVYNYGFGQKVETMVFEIDRYVCTENIEYLLFYTDSDPTHRVRLRDLDANENVGIYFFRGAPEKARAKFDEIVSNVKSYE
jgi:hypothetical protein